MATEPAQSNSMAVEAAPEDRQFDVPPVRERSVAAETMEGTEELPPYPGAA